MTAQYNRRIKKKRRLLKEDRKKEKAREATAKANKNK